MSDGKPDVENDYIQEQLRSAAAALKKIAARLEGIHAGLPVSPREDVMLLGEEDMDFATEVRSVIECVLNDNIQPAIRDLKAAAAYQPSSKSRKKELDS
jgi:hypothetical protein